MFAKQVLHTPPDIARLYQSEGSTIAACLCTSICQMPTIASALRMQLGLILQTGLPTRITVHLDSYPIQLNHRQHEL